MIWLLALYGSQTYCFLGGDVVYRSYPQRWWLLLTAVLLNLANYSHWVSFPSVSKVAARYYDQSGEAMDLIPTLSYGLGVPCCLVATYVVERFGLKAGLHIGGSLTGLGRAIFSCGRCSCCTLIVVIFVAVVVVYTIVVVAAAAAASGLLLLLAL